MDLVALVLCVNPDGLGEMGNAKIALSKLVTGLKCSGSHEVELTDRKGKKVCVLEYSIAWRGLRSRRSIAKHNDKKIM